MYLPKFLTAIGLALAISLSGPAAMAQDKKKGGGKKGSAKIVKREGSRPAARVSRPSQPRTTQTVMRSNSNRGQERVSRPKAQRPVERRLASSSRGQRQFTERRDNARSAASRAQLASSTTVRDRSDNARRDVQRARVAARSNDTRADLARREFRDRDSSRSRDLNRVVRDRDRDRDRSRFVTRHERHDHDWFVRNNYIYDRDYWHTHHVHRYYNDSLGVFIVSPIGPDYGYGSTYASGYSDYYGFDYQTRVAVQQSLAELGYYNGPIDGMIGPGTSAAIERFQADNGLAITGGINNSLLQSLQIL